MARFDLNTPLTFPLNTQKQTKTGYKFTNKDRNRWFDWYNACFRLNYTLEATNYGNALPADTTSSTLNGSASLIQKLVVKSGGKNLYNADDAHKAVLSKIFWIFPMTMEDPQQKVNFGIWILLTQLF